MKVIYQLSFKLDNLPKGVPIVDCRVIRNPFKRFLTDKARKEAVRNDRKFNDLVEKAITLLQENDEIVIACTHGRHRSGAIAEEVALRTNAKIRKGRQRR